MSVTTDIFISYSLLDFCARKIDYECLRAQIFELINSIYLESNIFVIDSHFQVFARIVSPSLERVYHFQFSVLLFTYYKVQIQSDLILVDIYSAICKLNSKIDPLTLFSNSLKWNESEAQFMNDVIIDYNFLRFWKMNSFHRVSLRQR